VGLEQVVSGLAFPLYLTAPAEDARLFIVEKGGAIRIVKDGALLPAPFLDLTGRVATGSEQGLSAWPSILTTPATVASWCITPT
jgi:hypothetical protein